MKRYVEFIFYINTSSPPTQKKTKKKQKDMTGLAFGNEFLDQHKFLNRTSKVQVLNVSIDVSNVAQLAYRMPSTYEC